MLSAFAFSGTAAGAQTDTNSASADAAAQEVEEATTHAMVSGENPPQQEPPVVELADTYYETFPRPALPQDPFAIGAKQADYPPSSWMANEQGSVRYIVDINAEGRPTSCTITESSGHAALDKRSCEIVMERGTFDPAYDANEQPIAGSYEGHQFWRKREPEFPGTATVHHAFDVSKTGEVSNCKIVEMSGNVPDHQREQYERNPCPFGTGRSRDIYRDENGNPVAKHVEFKFSIVVSDPE